MTKTRVVLVTCPTPGSANKIARRVLADRSAACVNIVPGVTSVYRWKGRIERSRELLLVIKTTAAAWPRLERSVKAVHPYEVPEIIALPVASGHRPYLEWVAENLSDRTQV
jgi:periplasmic divalent cation tolerance protein